MPAPDEAIMRGNQSISVRGADGGLAFGPTPNPQDRQTVFDATFYRPVNTSFTGTVPVSSLHMSCRLITSEGQPDWPMPGPLMRHWPARKDYLQ